METLSSKGFKSIVWEESEHDMNCPGGSYRCGRKTQLSQSPCEGRLIEGIPLLYQGLIPSTLCCIQETMKGQLKHPWRLVYIHLRKMDKDVTLCPLAIWMAWDNSKMCANLYSSTQIGVHLMSDVSDSSPLCCTEDTKEPSSKS